MLIAGPSVPPPILGPKSNEKFMHHRPKKKHNFKILASEFPAFLPKELENIKDPLARKIASRIERLSVHVRFQFLPKVWY